MGKQKMAESLRKSMIMKTNDNLDLNLSRNLKLEL